MANFLYQILHSSDTTVGSTEKWLQERDDLTGKIIIAPNTSSWPELKKGDRIIIFGGDMEAWEVDKNPWLAAEKEFIGRAIAMGIPIFGICLGSQLLAESLGATIHSSEVWEFGWKEVRIEVRGHQIDFCPFHCHSSYFSLPDNSFMMATNEFCANQGFKKGQALIGFQFHTEIDESRLKKIYSEWNSSRIGNVDSLEITKLKSPIYIEQLQNFYFTQLNEWLTSETNPLQLS